MCVTIVGQPRIRAATRYTDDTFARAGISLVDGNNTITAIASDSQGRGDTNSITVKLPATVTFNYDLKGNLTNDARRIFTYDDENQLVAVVVTNSTTDSTRSEFVYDGPFRRRVRKEFKWQGGTFIPTEEVRYVYDGRLPIQERNGYNVPLVGYTRGNDLSGSREGAGGIGGLLARTDLSTLNSIPLSTAFYHADGNGNVTALIDAQQRIAARYVYDPYGNTLAMSGPLAEANLYRFSSKEAHPASGLVYYLYRYYDPNLQRWVNRDPIAELGGVNLHGFVENSPTAFFDPYGLSLRGNLNFLLQWVFGCNPRYRYYSACSEETQEMRASLGGKALRDSFYEEGCQSVTLFGYGTADAFGDTFLKPKYWTSTALQVGGFDASANNNGDGTVTFCIWNRAGTRSFFYHAVGNAPWEQGPVSTVVQLFCWKESIDESKCKRN